MRNAGSPPRVRGARFTTCGLTDYLRSTTSAELSYPRDIGLDGSSYLLSGLCKSVSLRLFLVAVVRMLS